MATFAQIVLARAQESQGVWALDDTFTGGGNNKEEHNDMLADVTAAILAKDTVAGELAGKRAVMKTEHDFFKTMNVAIAGRLDSEVPDDDPLQKRVDEADNIRPHSEADIERRVEVTLVIWKEVNDARAALTPPKGAIVIRGVTRTQYADRYSALSGKRIERDEKEGKLTSRRTLERKEARRLDTANKDWYQAWKTEFPAGTDKGDALVNVHTEESSPPPGILVITGVTQTGLSLEVDYDPETGEHATVLELLYQVVGVHDEYQRVPANKAAGNTIGPFVQGQVVKLRTDVGNSRDFSEMSEEQETTIGPPV